MKPFGTITHFISSGLLRQTPVDAPVYRLAACENCEAALFSFLFGKISSFSQICVCSFPRCCIYVITSPHRLGLRLRYHRRVWWCQVLSADLKIFWFYCFTSCKIRLSLTFPCKSGYSPPSANTA